MVVVVVVSVAVVVACVVDCCCLFFLSHSLSRFHGVSHKFMHGQHACYGC